MSVLVKGMKMPDKCYKCKVHYLDLRNYICCLLKDDYSQVVGKFQGSAVDPDLKDEALEAVERPEWCPLVNIPTPHGDLVDRDEIVVESYEDADGYHIEINAPTVIESENE